MAKPAPTYECTACGARYPRAMGKCGACSAFGTIEEDEIFKRGGEDDG
mgnify:CR=1 FL=1